MCKLEKNLNRIYTLSGIILLIFVIMAMSSCSSTKKCCEKTINEVYKYEGEYINK
jgi:hypothetical protein